LQRLAPSILSIQPPPPTPDSPLSLSLITRVKRFKNDRARPRGPQGVFRPSQRVASRRIASQRGVSIHRDSIAAINPAREDRACSRATRGSSARARTRARTRAGREYAARARAECGTNSYPIHPWRAGCVYRRARRQVKAIRDVIFQPVPRYGIAACFAIQIFKCEIKATLLAGIAAGLPSGLRTSTTRRCDFIRMIYSKPSPLLIGALSKRTTFVRSFAASG